MSGPGITNFPDGMIAAGRTKAAVVKGDHIPIGDSEDGNKVKVAPMEAIYDLIAGTPPKTLDTLAKLAAAINDDPNFHSTLTTALAGKAPLASPALTGTPTAPTAAAGTNTTRLATTAFVTGALGDVVKLTGSQSIDGIKTFTASPVLPTAAAGDNSTKGATTAFVAGSLAGKAPLASPALTGTPTAPTAAAGTNTTQLATTAFVAGALDLKQDKSNAVTTDKNQVVTGKKTFRNTVNYYGPEEGANHSPFVFGCGSTPFWNTRQFTGGNLSIQASGTSQTVLMFILNGGIPYVGLYGTPTAPTAAPGTNTTQLATTAFCAAGFLPRFEAVVERTAATTAAPNKLYVNVKHDAGLENTLMLTLPSPTGNAGKVIGLTSRYRRSLYTGEEANWKLTGHIDGIASNTYWQGYWEIGSALLWCDGTTWHMLTDWRAEQEW